MMSEAEIAARKEMRKLQMSHGHKFTPQLTVYIGNVWNSALEKDPEGSQLKYVIEELKELVGLS